MTGQWFDDEYILSGGLSMFTHTDQKSKFDMGDYAKLLAMLPINKVTGYMISKTMYEQLEQQGFTEVPRLTSLGSITGIQIYPSPHLPDDIVLGLDKDKMVIQMYRLGEDFPNGHE
jgi:hypothetical protein